MRGRIFALAHEWCSEWFRKSCSQIFLPMTKTRKRLPLWRGTGSTPQTPSHACVEQTRCHPALSPSLLKNRDATAVSRLATFTRLLCVVAPVPIFHNIAQIRQQLRPWSGGPSPTRVYLRSTRSTYSRQTRIATPIRLSRKENRGRFAVPGPKLSSDLCKVGQPSGSTGTSRDLSPIQCACMCTCNQTKLSEPARDTAK